MKETPDTIAQWSRETFGEAKPADICARARDEMRELRWTIEWYEHDLALEEIADVIIVLCRLGQDYGDLWGAVEKKMAINRARKWDGWRHVE